MRALLGLILSLLISIAKGGGISEPLSDPKAFLRVVEALESSPDDTFVSKRDSDGGSTTYHLKQVNLLGTVTRGSETFYLAEAGYIRSRPQGREAPPARGHSFLVALSFDFKVAAYSRNAGSGFRLDGNHLMKGDELIVDFGKSTVASRFSGYGAIELPYFFADRITDEQWADDDFIMKEAAKE